MKGKIGLFKIFGILLNAYNLKKKTINDTVGTWDTPVTLTYLQLKV